MELSSTCHRRKLQDAARIMDEMGAAGVQPNEVTYSVVILQKINQINQISVLCLVFPCYQTGYVAHTQKKRICN
jgi:pentatricopeptide repeat protein